MKNKIYITIGIFLLILGISITKFQNKTTLTINEYNEIPEELAIIVGGVEVNNFPQQSDGYKFDKIVCENNSPASFNSESWTLDITLTSGDKCVVFFEKLPEPNVPALNEGLIPVTIDNDGTVKIADTSTKWYNYNSSEWANAVLVEDTFTTRIAGTTIPMDQIFQMYVWIPRYSYDAATIINPDSAITIEFVDTNVEAHPSFTFGTEELSGIWVGKFEFGLENKVIPNINSMSNLSVSQFFNTINSIKTTHGLTSVSDMHMMKNSDWGAVTYLSQSVYGICESASNCNKVENNSYYLGSSISTITTGCGGSDTSTQVTCPDTNKWNTENGMKASTTGNITGIYDMAGGRSEYMMTSMLTYLNEFETQYSQFTEAPDNKYYDTYPFGGSAESSNFTRGNDGDATKELYSQSTTAWNSDFKEMPSSSNFWVSRGGLASSNTSAGIFAIGGTFSGGGAYLFISTRTVITP